MKPLGEDDPREIGGFRLLGLLGEGGMGRVFVGRSRGDRLVAVKIRRDALAADPVSAERFRREIETAQRVSGAFTAPVVRAGPDDDPPWLATALGGPSLAEVVSELGPLPPAAIWRLAGGLAEVLENVHASGYVHRDLKPANVLLDTAGVKLIDFGVSRSSDSSITLTGTLIGTFEFMSPEQRLGEPAESPSDVYSLGCVIAFAAAGSVRGLLAAGTGAANAPDVLGVPDVPGLRDLLRACLAEEPSARPEPSRLMEEAMRRGVAWPPIPPVNYWPEPVASFAGSWQHNLLSDATPDGAGLTVGQQTIGLLPRTRPLPSGPLPSGPLPSAPRPPDSQTLHLGATPPDNQTLHLGPAPARHAPPLGPTPPAGQTPSAGETLPASLAFLESPASSESPTLADPAPAPDPAPGPARPEAPVRLGGPALPGELARLRADSAPAPSIGRHPDAAAHAARGDLLRLRHQLSDAADAYQASIDLDPADPEVRNDLGITLCALGRLTDAERSFRRAIGLAPDYLAAHHNLCVTLRADERFADAAESARRAIAIADDDPDGYENLGDALYRLARPGEATDAYRRAAALDPGNPRLDRKLRLTRQAS